MKRLLVAAVVVSCSAPAATPPVAPATMQQPAAARPEGKAKYQTLSSDSVPRFFPNFVTPCPSDDIGVIMADHFNPALTRIADALFHSTKENRLEEVAEAAAVVLGCAQTVTVHRSVKVTEDQWPVFDHFMIQLVMNTQALQSAALEDEIEDVTHWFHHVKQSCAGCHSRFNSR